MVRGATAAALSWLAREEEGEAIWREMVGERPRERKGDDGREESGRQRKEAGFN